MFEEFYEMYETEEQEVVALINRCIGGGFNWKGNFWEMTVVTLGVVFCDTGKVSTKEERLEWPVTDEEPVRSSGGKATVAYILEWFGIPSWQQLALPGWLSGNTEDW